MYSKLAPVALAACLIAPVTRARRESTPAEASAFDVSTDMLVSRSPRTAAIVASALLPKDARNRRHTAGLMVNAGLRSQSSSLRGAQRRSNPESFDGLDCFASLAMTATSSFLIDRLRVE